MSQALHALATSQARGRASRPDQELDAAIGRKLRSARWARGLTLRELAAISGLTIQQIQRSEAGVARVTVVTLLRLAEALKISPHTLLSDVTPDAATGPIIFRQSGLTGSAASRDEPALARDLAQELADYLRQCGSEADGQP